jgi:hypothetical protein
MFYKREKEVQDRLTNSKALESGSNITSPQDQKALQTAVDTYFNLSRKILEDALLLLQEETWTAEKHRNSWENHITSKSTAAFCVLRDALKYKKETPFVNVVSELITQESLFFMRLANLPFCDVMYAKPIEYKKQFNTEKKNLLEKWKSLQNENESINSTISGGCAELLKVYKDGLSKVGGVKDHVRQEIKTYLSVIAAAGKLVAGVSIPSQITQSIGLMADALNIFMPKGKEMASRFDQLYRSEENVVVIMFGGTRKSVKEFLEKTNLDKCQADYNAALKGAQANAAGMLTDGQKADAQKFVDEAELITKKTMISFTDAYNGFVNEFKEIFIGPVGDRKVNDLIKKERMDYAKNELQQLNIQTELKKIYDDSREWINLDMYELTPEKKAEVVKALKNERDRLDLALSQAGDRSILDAIGLYFSVVKETTFNKVKNT